ncbi:MAG: hypothetical protein RBR52_12560, partial [Thiomonas sp.]|uniref:hypothetical protein n=1 Tax=Thiomonas sp. TaxID=2047785 RepID=UPI002A3651FC
MNRLMRSATYALRLDAHDESVFPFSPADFQNARHEHTALRPIFSSFSSSSATIRLVAHFSDRGRLFHSDRGRRFRLIVDAPGVRASDGFTVSQSSTIS